MSQHPSLSAGKKKRHRSVLKRYERLKHMKEKDIWEEDKSSIFGLPKIKVIKFRVKKEKAVEEVPAEEAAAAEAEVPAKEAAGTQPGKEKGKGVKEEDTKKKEKK